LGYLSNKADESTLISPQWRARMADAMTRAVDQYFAPAASASLQ
jgi:N-acetylmuramoyl-L-alanine amidase